MAGWEGEGKENTKWCSSKSKSSFESTTPPSTFLPRTPTSETAFQLYGRSAFRIPRMVYVPAASVVQATNDHRATTQAKRNRIDARTSETLLPTRRCCILVLQCPAHSFVFIEDATKKRKERSRKLHIQSVVHRTMNVRRVARKDTAESVPSYYIQKAPKLIIITACLSCCIFFFPS